MANGDYGMRLLGTITRVPTECRQYGKALKIDIDVVCSKYNSKEPQFFTVVLWNYGARNALDRFSKGIWQKGDLIYIPDGDINVYAYQGKDGKIKQRTSIIPKGHKVEIRDKETGEMVSDWRGGYQVIFGPNHVKNEGYEPEPEHEREAIPPEDQAPFVEVNDEGELPWD